MTARPLAASALPLTAHTRTAPEVVDAAIQLVRRHYATLVTVSAVAFLPLVLLAPVYEQWMSLPVNVLSILCAGYAEACLLLGLAAAYRGESLPSVGALLGAGRRVAGPVIRIALARSVATWIGLIFLIVPGLFAYAHYLLGTPVAALEGLKVRPAITRGASLAKGEYKRLVLVAGLSGLLYIVLSLTAVILAQSLTQSLTMAYLVGILLQIALTPAIVAITILLYFDVRERREGLDLEVALGSVGAMPARQGAP